jgi:hypothetical protein
MTITEFLLARIAEDEADVRGHAFDYTYQDTGVSVCRHESHRLSGWPPACWRAQVAPRVLAECEAKRRIVERCDPHMTPEGATWEHEGLAMDVLGELASVYADHPDYREEWRP